MPEDLKGRTCETCACVYVAETPRVVTPEQLKRNPELAGGSKILICRLNPPTFFPDGKGGMRLGQQPTAPYMSCWWWKQAGTLPGDAVSLDTVQKILA